MPPVPFLDDLRPFAAATWAFVADDADHQRLLIGLLAAFTTIWIASLGAVIGSFLNVVVYRLPHGLSLNRPKSRCPVCETPIRRRDNVPIFGWLVLRGRCRACGTKISPRYPLVELATAALFLGLAHVELLSGGDNIPLRPTNVYDGILNTVWYTRWDLVGLYAYHLALFCTLLSLALIVWDGFAPPRRLVVTGLLFGLVPPAVMPTLHPVPPGWPALPEWTTALASGGRIGFAPGSLLTSLVGLAAGLLVGRLLAAAVPATPRSAADRRGTIVTAGLIGTFFGWQAAVSFGLFAAALAFLAAVLSRGLHRPLPVTMAAAAATMLQIVLWRAAARVNWWPNHTGWGVLREIGWPEPLFAVTSLATAVVLTAAVAGLARFVTRSAPWEGEAPAEPQA